MPLQDRIQKQQVKARTAVEPYLEPGERAAVVLTGARPNFWFILMGAIPYLIISRYHYLVVTDRGVLVLEISKYKSYTVKRLVSRGSHADMELGPVKFPGIVTARVGDTSYSITGARFLGDLFATARETLGTGAGSTSVA
jgi:hypothetical protein